MKARLRLPMIGSLATIALFAAVPQLTTFADSPDQGRAASGNGWTAGELAVLASMQLSKLPPAPPDPSNAVEDRPQAAALGKRLFNDTGFSRNQAVSCASCHAPDKQFQDGLAVGHGVGEGTRRTMPIVAAAHGPWKFWDGRKDSLWSQALGPLEDAVEHGGNRTRYAHRLRANYRTEYEALFGPLPDLAGLPQDAGPGGNAAERAAWEAMPPVAREAVSRVFANMGKSIAAYEKTLTFGESRFDQYVRAVLNKDSQAGRILSEREVAGLRVFIGGGQCSTCHNGPLFTDQHFHNTGVPPRNPAQPDQGRAAAIARVQRDEFNCLGSFSDARPEECSELRFMADSDPGMMGAFKTPGLRNVALRAPYMHAGQFASLDEVISHYIRSPAAATGHSELAADRDRHAGRAPIRISEREARDLAAFLGSLTGPVIERGKP